MKEKKENPSYYANIPADVRYSDIPANAKLLYGEITALANKEGYCWANNKYFADLYKKNIATISVWIRALKEKGFVEYEVEDNYKRKIYLRGVLEKSNGGIIKNTSGVLEKSKHNITSNTTNNNTTNVSKETDKSVPLEEKVSDKSYNGRPEIFLEGEVQLEEKESFAKEKEETSLKERSYGRPDINEVYKFLKDKLGGSPDGSQQGNRRFAKLLLDKMKKDYPNKSPVDLVKSLIEFGLRDDFHGKNITNFKYLYYNVQKIILSIKNKRRKGVILEA